jgi:hypothetical protein
LGLQVGTNTDTIITTHFEPIKLSSQSESEIGSQSISRGYNSSKSFVCFWRRRAMKAEEVMSKVPEERRKKSSRGLIHWIGLMNFI